MDDVVLAAIARWPAVPAVSGWLRLGARGVWWVRLSDAANAAFDPITNPAFIAFIGRNYACDDAGRWFFQNGPQRVFVSIDAAPWIVRLADAAERLVTHTGLAVQTIVRAHVDEDGMLYLATEHGLAIVLDRDLPRVADAIVPPESLDHEAFFERVAAGETVAGGLFGGCVAFSLVARSDLPALYHFSR